MFGLESEDVRMAEVIWKHGLSVDEFILLKNSGSLPDEIKGAWESYKSWLEYEEAT